MNRMVITVDNTEPRVRVPAEIIDEGGRVLEMEVDFLGDLAEDWRRELAAASGRSESTLGSDGSDDSDGSE